MVGRSAEERGVSQGCDNELGFQVFRIRHNHHILTSPFASFAPSRFKKSNRPFHPTHIPLCVLRVFAVQKNQTARFAQDAKTPGKPTPPFPSSQHRLYSNTAAPRTRPIPHTLTSPFASFASSRFKYKPGDFPVAEKIAGQFNSQQTKRTFQDPDPRARRKRWEAIRLSRLLSEKEKFIQQSQAGCPRKADFC